MLASAHSGLCRESVGSMILRGVCSVLCAVCCVRDAVYYSANIVVFDSGIPMELEWFYCESVSLQVV